MSLNKFTNTDVGKKLQLEIGAKIISAEELLVDSFVSQGVIQADRIIANQFVDSQIYFSNGVPNPVVKNFLITEGVSNKTVVSTFEGTLNPNSQVGSQNGFFPPETLQEGSVLKFHSSGRISASPTGEINIRFYMRDGTYLIAETGNILVGGSPTNDLYKIEISLVQRNATTSCQGTFTIMRPSPVVFELMQVNFDELRTMTNEVLLTGQWLVADPQNDITLQQFEVEIKEPQPIV